MKTKNLITKGIVSALSLATISFSTLVTAATTLSSATILEFADEKTLFVADSDASQVLAFEMPAVKAVKDSVAYNLKGAGSEIAQLLGTDSSKLSYHDIAVHPQSKEVYVSVSVQEKGKSSPAVIRVNQTGQYTKVNLSQYPSTTKTIEKTATDDVTFWRDIPAASLAITDLDYVNGTLYVSSLSTGEFSSTLRQIPYPFNQNKSNTAHVEIYHTVHDQTETRAPIRAMTVLDLDGVETVVAAYTCTPLVTIPTKALTEGTHVKGKTVAELGYGNTPLDVIHFSAPNERYQMEEFVLVVHKERNADLIRVADLAQANKTTGLSEPEMWAQAGVKSRPLPLAGVLQVADQDGQFIATLRRNLTTGDMDIVSFRKGAYFRLNDFISEYNFPDYKYSEEQEMYREFQNVLKADSGYSDLTRK